MVFWLSPLQFPPNYKHLRGTLLALTEETNKGNTGMFHKMYSARLTIFPGLRHGSTYKSAQNKCAFPGGLLTFLVHHITWLYPTEASKHRTEKKQILMRSGMEPGRKTVKKR